MGAYEIVQKLEKQRRQVNLYALIGAFSFVGSIIFHIFFSGFFGTEFIVALPILIIAIILMTLSAKKTKEFKTLYKGTFVNSVLNEFFEDSHYIYNSGFSVRQVADFGLTRMGNRFNSEDYLQATYKGVHFEQADVKVQYHSSGKNSHTTTYFSGRMFVFDFSKHNVLPVQIFDETFMYRANTAERFKMNKVNMESVEFNKRFDVKAARDQDAFYILTPQMMENILNLKQKYGSVLFNFSSGRLCLGIECGMNAFDANMKKPINYAEEKEKMRNDVSVIIDIIDTMNLIS